MNLTTKATADYAPINSGSLNRNRGKAVATGRLKGAHWATQAEKYLDGNTTIATKAGGINCTIKPVTFDCKLDLTTTAPPGGSCGLGAGISCVTVPAAPSVNQSWESKIISSPSDVDISYSVGGNSVPIGGKGVGGGAEAYAKNGQFVQAGGPWHLQGAEGKATARSVVEVNLENVRVIRQAPPASGVTTTCTQVASSEDPAIMGSTIRISCGERLLK